MRMFRNVGDFSFPGQLLLLRTEQLASYYTGKQLASCLLICSGKQRSKDVTSRYSFYTS